ncbi:kin of IRRE-like protein 2 isoform X1 [Pecten maximus]|uniref:kin of IRRE-like protein 2 isoform X1 n=1 Tax=Pecten maximus TaxID=6579 RepID=UPI00145897EC|nr:kin of IRRE-like protein 2 isoform X1 [Pecten maximus]
MTGTSGYCGPRRQWILLACKVNLVLSATFMLVSARERYNYNSRYPVPNFLTSETNVSYMAGDKAVLECAVENLGTRTVVWRKLPSTTPLTIGRFLYISNDAITVGHQPDSHHWNLHIHPVTADDEGEYECQVSSSDKTIRQRVNLTVVARWGSNPYKKEKGTSTPDIRIFSPEHVNKGHPIQLHCNATGADTQLDELDWFINGHRVSTNFQKGVYIDKTVSLGSNTISSTLHIAQASMDDMGTYTCRTSAAQIKSTKVTVLNDLSDIPKDKRDNPTDSVLLTAAKQEPSDSHNGGTAISLQKRLVMLTIVLWIWT